jgi:acetylornithine deacetylase/succinyl-diaminopimelate desuccinylase-like protein
LADHLRQVGLNNVTIARTKGHPIVYADWRHARDRPTVLIYGHYDVQPAEPLNEWRSPPFEPAVRGNRIYGRGASDDKGQLFTHLKSLESLLRTGGRLPVNVRCIFEGEEEIGSPNLCDFLSRNHELISADIAVMSDTRMLAPQRPALIYALRGALSLELGVRGPSEDLHSGNFGGVIHNPVQALCEIVAALHDAQGRIAVPGFYDRVQSLSDKERHFMARSGPSDEAILTEAKAGFAWGEPGYTLYERTTSRPALTLNGLRGGYQGPGPKAIIPQTADIKMNLRLVPDQRPDEIRRLMQAYIADLTPPSVTSAVRFLSAAPSVVLDRSHPAMRAASNAYLTGFGRAPIFIRSGGTIPAVSAFHQVLGIPSVLMGFGLSDDHIHGANESFHLRSFVNGIATAICFLKEVALGRTSVLASERSERSARRRNDWHPLRPNGTT